MILLVVFGLSGCGRTRTAAITPALKVIFDQLNLKPSEPSASNHKELQEIEAADAKEYHPVAWTLLLLESSSATSDSKGELPRYWLAIEDYDSPGLARSRAREYALSGAYDRAAASYGKANSLMVPKLTIRIWAVARGNRVYALTTDTSLYALLKMPQDLKNRIEELPVN